MIGGNRRASIMLLLALTAILILLSLSNKLFVGEIAPRVTVVAPTTQPTHEITDRSLSESLSQDISLAASPPVASNLSLQPPGPATKLTEAEGLAEFTTPDLAGRYDELAARARSGDAQAAHQLGLELRRCQYYFERLGDLDGETNPRNIANLDPNVQDANYRNAERLLDRMRPLEEMCAGVSPSQYAEAVDWLEMAADRGDLDSAAAYYVIGVGNLAELATRPDQLMQFRSNASRFLHQGAQRCNPATTSSLSNSYRYGVATQVDLARAYAYSLTAQWQTGLDPLAPGGPETIRPMLDDLQFNQAVDFAHRFYNRYCR